MSKETHLAKDKKKKKKKKREKVRRLRYMLDVQGNK